MHSSELASPWYVRLEVTERVATITLIKHPERKNPLAFESYAGRRDPHDATMTTVTRACCRTRPVLTHRERAWDTGTLHGRAVASPGDGSKANHHGI